MDLKNLLDDSSPFFLTRVGFPNRCEWLEVSSIFITLPFPCVRRPAVMDNAEDYTEDLGDDDLLEDDEIDDDDAAAAAESGNHKSLSKSSEAHWSAVDDRSYASNSDTEQQQQQQRRQGRTHDNNNTKDGKDKISPRRPPRPARSASVSRKQKVQGGGSMHRRRTTRRVAASEKQRPSSNTPPITVRDIMGSEKKATSVGIAHSGHSRPTVPASPVKGSKTGAEQKRSMIRSRWKEKQNRQSDVKNSLAQFLATESQSEGSDHEFFIDAEDDELISDVDDEAHRRDSSYTLDHGADEDSDDAKSVKSAKSTKSQRRRRGVTKRTDANATTGDGEVRHRAKKTTGGASDDKSVGGSSRKPSRRSPRPGAEGSSSVRHRPSDEGASGDGEQLRRHRDTDDGHNKKTRSSSTRRKSSENGDAPTKPRSTRRKSHADDDDRSVGSKKSVGGRGRRQQHLHRSKVSSSTDPAHSSTKTKSTKRHSEDAGSESPSSSKPNSSSSLFEENDKATLLARHIESTPKPRTLLDLEERSEESSRFSTNYDQPTSLLQFDPTNANNITLVKQDKSNVLSDRFRNADGTESEFHISKLTGLPTFEASGSKFHDSNFECSSSELRPQSARSMGSVEYESEDNMAHAAKSMSHIGYSTKNNGTPRINSEEGAVTPHGGRNGRGGVSKTNTAGRTRGVASSKSFQDSMKGLFGVWNKKGECEMGDDDEEQPKSNRFFRKREDIAHQALDDDESDEN